MKKVIITLALVMLLTFVVSAFAQAAWCPECMYPTYNITITQQGGGAYYAQGTCYHCGYYAAWGNHGLCGYCSYTWCNWDYVKYSTGSWHSGRICPYHGAQIIYGGNN